MEKSKSLTETPQDGITPGKSGPDKDPWFCTGNHVPIIWKNVIPFLDTKDKYQLRAVSTIFKQLVDDDFRLTKSIEPPSSMKRFPMSLKVMVCPENIRATKINLTDFETSLEKSTLTCILSNKPKLQRLELRNTDISDDVLTVLSSECSKLEYLSISGNVYRLAPYPLHNLQHLYLTETTPAGMPWNYGLVEFLDAHPNLKTLEMDIHSLMHPYLPLLEMADIISSSQLQCFTFRHVDSSITSRNGFGDYQFVKNLTTDGETEVVLHISSKLPWILRFYAEYSNTLQELMLNKAGVRLSTRFPTKFRYGLTNRLVTKK